MCEVSGCEDGGNGVRERASDSPGPRTRRRRCPASCVAPGPSGCSRPRTAAALLSPSCNYGSSGSSFLNLPHFVEEHVARKSCCTENASSWQILQTQQGALLAPARPSWTSQDEASSSLESFSWNQRAEGGGNEGGDGMEVQSLERGTGRSA